MLLWGFACFYVVLLYSIDFDNPREDVVFSHYDATTCVTPEERAARAAEEERLARELSRTDRWIVAVAISSIFDIFVLQPAYLALYAVYAIITEELQIKKIFPMSGLSISRSQRRAY